MHAVNVLNLPVAIALYWPAQSTRGNRMTPADQALVRASFAQVAAIAPQAAALFRGRS